LRATDLGLDAFDLVASFVVVPSSLTQAMRQSVHERAGLVIAFDASVP
jgi:hypothetical protein